MRKRVCTTRIVPSSDQDRTLRYCQVRPIPSEVPCTTS
jgi:hypothetical protein